MMERPGVTPQAERERRIEASHEIEAIEMLVALLTRLAHRPRVASADTGGRGEGYDLGFEHGLIIGKMIGATA